MHLIRRTTTINVQRIFEEAYFNYSSAIRLAQVDGKDYWGGEVSEGEHILLFRCEIFLKGDAEDRVNHVLELARQPVPEIDEYAIHFCGVIESEECMGATLEDGRVIIVQQGPYLGAPEDRRDDPLYWLARWESDEFAIRDSNPPSCWVHLPGRKGKFDRPEREGEYINHI
jgi:hypothetical protein